MKTLVQIYEEGRNARLNDNGCATINPYAYGGAESKAFERGWLEVDLGGIRRSAYLKEDENDTSTRS